MVDSPEYKGLGEPEKPKKRTVTGMLDDASGLSGNYPTSDVQSPRTFRGFPAPERCGGLPIGDGRQCG